MSEIKSYNPQRFHHFLAHLTRLMDQSPNEMQALDGASQLLGDLVSSDDWLLPDFAQPHPNHYQQYLLFADPQDRFSVVSFVWGPGQSTPIHDHTVWGLIGMLRGSEMCQSYSRMSDGRWAPAGLQIQMIPGDIEAVSPRLGDVHRVWNAYSDQVSISIHLYGANIGKIQRSVYYEDGSRQSFISGYANVPELFSGLVAGPSAPTHVSQNTSSKPSFTERFGVTNTAQTTTKSAPSKEAARLNPGVSSVASEDTAEKSELKLSNQASQASQTTQATQATRAVQVNDLFSALDVDSSSLKEASSTQIVQEELKLYDPAHDERSSSSNVGVAASEALSLETSKDCAKDSLIDSSIDSLIESSSKGSLSAQPIATEAFPKGLATTESTVTEQAVKEPIPSIGGFEVVTPAQVRNYLLLKTEIALIDVREEDPYAQSHPLFACNLPLGRIETDAYRRIPRRDTLLVIYDNSEGLALRSANTLKRMGYTRITLLEGGLSGWAASGAELFRDVNVPSKAFGEWVETFKRTPSLPASEVKALLDQKADVVVLDARRFDEYQTMSIPGAISVPGAELALRVRSIAPKATTRIVVNCAGRTRSIIGAQSLVNAGIPNPVCALRNGTIGWMLEGQELVKGAQLKFPETDPADLAKAQASALALAFRSSIKRIDLKDYEEFIKQVDRTTYLFDVRTPEEYAVSHLKGALSAPGGQLVQETDHNAPVRGARIVLYDTDGVRAYMTGSWLVQLGWEVCVIKNLTLADLTPVAEITDFTELPAPLGEIEEATPAQVKEWIANRTNLTLVIDVGDSAQYVKRHIPGAWWLLRSQMQQDFSRVHKANRYVLTCTDGKASRYAVEELKQLVRPGVQVMWLKGGNAAWIEQGFSTQQGESYVVSPRIDRYRRPYEGTQNPVQAMQAYLDWEYGLVDQLKRDGTHGFKVI